MGKQFPDVSCKYGAPMGRTETLPYPFPGDGAETVRFRLWRVRLDSGGYDDGGAYWGIGPPALYVCEGGGVCVYQRAYSREGAKAEIQRRFPQVKKFYR